MRLSFLPAKQLHEAHTRGLFVHLHKKWQLEAEKKPSISLSFLLVSVWFHAARTLLQGVFMPMMEGWPVQGALLCPGVEEGSRPRSGKRSGEQKMALSQLGYLIILLTFHLRSISCQGGWRLRAACAIICSSPWLIVIVPFNHGRMYLNS